MHRKNPLDLGPRVSRAWMVAFLGIRPRTPPPATCWGQKYLWSEDQSLPKQIPPVGGQMDLGILAMFLSCPKFGRHTFCPGSEPADHAHAEHVLADHACREVQKRSGLGHQEPWVTPGRGLGTGGVHVLMQLQPFTTKGLGTVLCRWHSWRT